jgi:FAD/FMN-containing dehydrogenase
MTSHLKGATGPRARVDLGTTVATDAVDGAREPTPTAPLVTPGFEPGNAPQNAAPRSLTAPLVFDRLGPDAAPTAGASEQPPAYLLALVDASTGVRAHRRPWERLSADERLALASLGYDRTSWSRAQNGELSALPPAASLPFERLGPEQQRAVSALGLDAEQWNGDVAARSDLFRSPALLAAVSRALSEPGEVSEETVRRELLPAARRFLIETPTAKATLLYVLSFWGGRFTDGGRKALRDEINHNTLLDSVAGGFKNLGWNASIVPTDHRNPGPLDPVIANDASGESAVMLRQRVEVKGPQDVWDAIDRGHRTGSPLCIAGRRHSEGGQTLSPGGIQLDMRGMNRMQLLGDGKTLRVEAGATWAEVQAELAKYGLAVRVMQTSNIFTVGGALSVNCHGRTPGEPPFISTVKSFRIMMADGTVKTCSRDENYELFKHVIGGYGLFGVVLDIDLDTRPNVMGHLEVEAVSTAEFPERMRALQGDPKAKGDPAVELAYGRLSPDGKTTMLYVVRKAGDAKAEPTATPAKGGLPPEVMKWAMKLSKLGPEELQARWWAENKTQAKQSTDTLTHFMSPNVDGLRQLWFDEGRQTDILHEYFIPWEHFTDFRDGLALLEREYGTHTLNTTLRQVSKDDESALAYATADDSCAFVLYFNQKISPKGDARQAELTQKLIDLAHQCKGTFYLPYQLHYTAEQLRTSYPKIDQFFATKRRYDPHGVFSNMFYEKYGRD